MKERSDHDWLGRLGRAGLRVAQALVVFAFSAATVSSSGCLVTDDIKFQEQEDVPPSFVFHPAADPRIGDTLRVDTEALEASGTTNLSFKLQVRDENVLQPIQTQIRLRTLASESGSVMSVINEDGSEIPGNGNAVRDFEFSFLTTVLSKGHCHQLELAVSGEFFQLDDEPDAQRLFGAPVLDGDLAIATWWLWEIIPGAQPPVDLETCPTHVF